MTFFFFFNIQSLFSLTSNLPQNSFFHLYVVIQYLKLWESWNALHTFLRKCLSCLHITWKEEMRGTWRLFLKWVDVGHYRISHMMVSSTQARNRGVVKCFTRNQTKAQQLPHHGLEKVGTASLLLFSRPVYRTISQAINTELNNWLKTDSSETIFTVQINYKIRHNTLE